MPFYIHLPQEINKQKENNALVETSPIWLDMHPTSCRPEDSKCK